MTNIYNFTAKQLDKHELKLEAYKGQVLLIVNVASQCRFTAQYSELEKLYRAYKDQGFTILAFPCNQFGEQEPGSAYEIQAFCQTNYNISFPLFAKVEVKGSAAHPLFKFLTAHSPGLLGSKTIKWNFTKFLVDRAGKPVQRFAPISPPSKLEQAIVRQLSYEEH